MRRTVAKISNKGTYRVVFDDTKYINPYTIYRETYDIDADFHAKKIVSYADLKSCLYHLSDIVDC